MRNIIFKKLRFDCSSFFVLSIISISLIIWVAQAVNFLDFVTEDGHSFKVYFLYSLLNIPKIVSKIFPFIFFISLIYILVKYENNNELIIYWNYGIKKNTFTKVVLLFSLLYLFIQLILTSYIVPYSQNKARSYIRDSNIDLFQQLIKEKQFIDTILNLTIFVENKDQEGNLNNIYLKEFRDSNNSQIIVAKRGNFFSDKKNKFLLLYDGEVINQKNKKINQIKFEKTKFNLSKFDTQSHEQVKTQENTTYQLIKCIEVTKNFELKEKALFENCRIQNSVAIHQELYKRLITPIFIPVLALIALLLIIKSKNQKNYINFRNFITIYGLIILILSESFIRLINSNYINNVILISVPFIIFLANYFYLRIRVLK